MCRLCDSNQGHHNKMDYIINHERFKRIPKKEELEKYIYKENRIIKYPQYFKNYYNFFSTHAKEKYQLIDNKCICGSKSDLLLSRTDRHCVEFTTVICKSCGLIRAQKYFRDEDVIDFYKNYYRTQNYSNKYVEHSPKDFFEEQKLESKFKFELLNKYKIKEIRNIKIVDLGGGIGGVLDHFEKNNELFLFDFYQPYLDYAKSRGINSIKGGLEKLNFKPDIIILSHVVEHWNNFDREIKKLINFQKKGETLNYIEFPGVDSVKDGRREGDILGDIHIPHVHYFTSYVFENLMNRYGFEKLYIDSFIKSIFIYTGHKSKLVNHFDQCYNDLKKAEKTRKLQIFKNILKYIILPKFIIQIIRKIKNLGNKN